MNKLFRILFSTYWITLINLVLATVLGYQTMHILLLVNDVPSTKLQTSPSHSTIASSTPINQPHIFNATPLLEANLFGAPQETAPKPSATPSTPPPATPLNLKLQGIYYSTEPQASLAIITTPDGKTDLYKLDKPLPNGITLYKIEPRKLILLRNGQQEILPLEGSRPAEGATKGADTQPAVNTNVPTASNNEVKPERLLNEVKPERLLGDYQRQLQANPQQLLNLIRLSPVNQESRFIGYRLSPGKDSQVMTQFNLQAGDVLTAVNGVKLDSPIKGLAVIEQLATADHLELQILRNGQLMPLSFNIENNDKGQ